MDTALAQIITFVAFGNAFLAGSDSDTPKLEPSHSTLKFVRSLSFVRQGEAGAMPMEPEQWFADLRVRRTRRLRLARMLRSLDLPSHIAVSFANGGDYVIEAEAPSAWEIWVPRWRASGAPAADVKPWDVEYFGYPIPGPAGTVPVSLGVAAANLGSCLKSAQEFAERVGAEPWQKVFRAASASLASTDLTVSWHPDMVPPGAYGLDARRLFAAASASWVFGGMGSWNDMGFSDASTQREYSELTANLYDAVMDALVTAASTLPFEARRHY